jgi:tetratricopeptide (TPR) repeat protein
MAQAGTAAAATPTPRLTATPPPTDTPAATLTPGASDTPAATATLDPLAPEYLYQQAYRSMLVSKYEDAIEWLDSLRALAPDYRPNEVLPMLMEALTEQGKIYLYGWNEDGEDKLMRGVLLIYRADELGTVEPSTLVGQANFVEMYINARNYVNGGQYAAALPVLQQLCDWNCGWSYRGVSVQDLLEQAQAGSGPSQ